MAPASDPAGGIDGLKRRVRVWDLPLRLFHWLLVPLVAAAFVTAKIGGNAMAWHGRAGLAIIGLLVFRIVWGFAGTRHARFASFVRGPSAIAAYLRGGWSGIGHNPLGALSVLGLLGLLVVQAATGLFADDDIAFRGYLHPLIEGGLAERLTAIHHLGEPLLVLLIALHLGAIAFYTRVRKDDLLRPMITGWKDTEIAADPEPDRGGGPLAFLLAALLAASAAWAASGAWLAPPPAAAGAAAW